MQPLKTQWKNLFRSIASPWIILFILLSLGFVYLSLNVSDKLIVAIAAGLFSICTSVTGAMIGNVMRELSEHDALQARGTLAVRSLKVLLNRIMRADVRLGTRLDNIEGTDIQNSPLTYCVDETRESLTSLQSDVLNAMEAWTDIIPEADIRTKIGEVNATQCELADLKNQLSEVTRQRDAAVGQSEATRQTADTKIQALREEIDRLSGELRDKKYQLHASTNSLIGIEPAYISPKSQFQLGRNFISQLGKCQDCGKDIGITTESLCNDCKNKRFGILLAEGPKAGTPPPSKQ